MAIKQLWCRPNEATTKTNQHVMYGNLINCNAKQSCNSMLRYPPQRTISPTKPYIVPGVVLGQHAIGTRCLIIAKIRVQICCWALAGEKFKTAARNGHATALLSPIPSIKPYIKTYQFPCHVPSPFAALCGISIPKPTFQIPT